MSLTPFTILIGIALILAVAGIVRPAWPLIPISVILICAALLIGK